MKIIQLTLHINSDECETIIDFIDEIKAVLIANYGHEIQENHRANGIISSAKNEVADNNF